MQITATARTMTNLRYSTMKVGLFPTVGGFQSCPVYMNSQIMSSTSLKASSARVNLM
jgi:hypothetical protein